MHTHITMPTHVCAAPPNTSVHLSISRQAAFLHKKKPFRDISARQSTEAARVASCPKRSKNPPFLSAVAVRAIQRRHLKRRRQTGRAARTAVAVPFPPRNPRKNNLASTTKPVLPAADTAIASTTVAPPPPRQVCQPAPHPI